MKIVKLFVKNFRGLRSIEVTFDENLNIVIGRNDIGKSSILEAMEIFFNNSIVKLDIDDLCKFSDEDFIEIGVSFALDSYNLVADTIPTNFKKEYLLDSDGFLTIIKRWDCSKTTITKSSLDVFIKANYPKDISTPYILLKSTDLKKLVKHEFGDKVPESVKFNTNHTMRLALYDCIDTSCLEEVYIPLDKEDAKKVWVNLEKEMPLFFLFQSDRVNKDSDKEVQDPLKAITKLAITEVQDELNSVVARIEQLVTKVGQDTIDKMKEMDSELAESLKPSLSNKSWDSLFSFTFIGDDEIPINKRGSGFRRLLLLNYFRAEAERQVENRPIIYAIEEPETALHPAWQLMLIDSLIQLSQRSNIQIFITTHSPSLAGQVDFNYIRYLHSADRGSLIIDQANESNFEEICNTLGILPSLSAIHKDNLKVALCLEGVNDVQFFFNISKLFDLDLKHDDRVITIPLGGDTLREWVDQKLLDKLNIPQIHIYDNDVQKYQKSIDKVNDRKDGSWGCLTQMREIENYIHPKLVKILYSLNCDYFIENPDWYSNWSNHDVPHGVKDFFIELKSSGANINNYGVSKIKSKLCKEGSALMTKELFEDLNAYDEVSEWFEIIKKRVES